MIFERTLAQIVDENYVYARALHYLGISFFENQEKSLRQVCLEKNLVEGQVIRSFYDFDGVKRLTFNQLKSYSIGFLLEYLQHTHYQFIKERLPFITHVAKNCDSLEFQKLFSEFVEDFIIHIYEEEDSLFKYVKVLKNIEKKQVGNPIATLMSFQNFSLQNVFNEHQNDDEMKAIREIVESIVPTSVKEKVLVNEVKALHRELLYHVEIENHIFFPKAIVLEKEVTSRLKMISFNN